MYIEIFSLFVKEGEIMKLNYEFYMYELAVKWLPRANNYFGSWRHFRNKTKTDENLFEIYLEFYSIIEEMPNSSKTVRNKNYAQQSDARGRCVTAYDCKIVA